MPSKQSRKKHNSRIAHEEPLHTHVYISGISGHHPLQVGLAYYYRGHYIYAYPARNLIEPVPYSTRKGIMIQGIVSGSAPGYEEGDARLVGEESVRALEVSAASEWAAKGVEVVEGHAGVATPSPSRVSLARASSAEAPRSCTRAGALLLSLPCPYPYPCPYPCPCPCPCLPAHTLFFTPRPGLSFQAASAPQSRLASRAASPAALRPTASHLGLPRLSALRGQPPHRVLAHDQPCFTEDAPFRTEAVGYLYGLGDHALSAEDLSCLEGTQGDQRVRVGGGVRVAPCAIHGEECDGVATERVWKTEEMRMGRGFVEEVPVVDAGGRVMVDWVGLLEEARAEGGK